MEGSSGTFGGAAGVFDGDAGGGEFDDGGDGGDPGLTGAVGDGDGAAGEVLGEQVGRWIGEGRAPGAIGEAAGSPAGDGRGVGGPGRRIGVGRSWRGEFGELLLEGLGDDLAGPGGDIEVVVGAEAGELLAELGIDADLERVASHTVMT